MFDPRQKDNLTDLASNLNDDDSGDSSLADNQVFGADDEVIDLGNSSDGVIFK